MDRSRWVVITLAALSAACAGSTGTEWRTQAVAVFGLDSCWESGPARDSDFGCHPLWVLYDDRSFRCGERSGQLSQRDADRIHSVAEQLLRRPSGGEFDSDLYLRRFRDAGAHRLTAVDAQALERVTPTLRERCAL